MKLGSFLSLLGIVALVAVIYSPSVIGLGLGSNLGTTSPTTTGDVGASQFLRYLRASGYRVVLVNDSQSEQTLMSSGRNVLLLIGADSAVSSQDVQTIQRYYNAGDLSLLIAEGNKTNEGMINTLFGATVTGAAISDPTSIFLDKSVLIVTVNLGGGPTRGILDIASPILLSSSSLRAASRTSDLSTDALNGTVGPRTVIATGTSAGGSRALLLTDSAPFLNYLFANQTLPVNETRFVGSMVDWTTQSNKGVTILYDDFHYVSQPPTLGLGIPVGPFVTYVLELELQQMNSFFSPSAGGISFFGISLASPLLTFLIGLLLLLSTYGLVRRWFAQEKRGNDDQSPPRIEKEIVAESRARLDFLDTSRRKSFLVATVAQLYEILDDVVAREFGAGISSVTEEQLAQRLGPEAAESGMKLFAELRVVYDYANGRRRLIFPPVLRWKSRTSNLTRRAERFLNELGMTIGGGGQEETGRRRVEYAAGRR